MKVRLKEEGMRWKKEVKRGFFRFDGLFTSSPVGHMCVPTTVPFNLVIKFFCHTKTVSSCFHNTVNQVLRVEEPLIHLFY